MRPCVPYLKHHDQTKMNICKVTGQAIRTNYVIDKALGPAAAQCSVEGGHQHRFGGPPRSCTVTFVDHCTVHVQWNIGAALYRSSMDLTCIQIDCNGYELLKQRNNNNIILRLVGDDDYTAIIKPDGHQIEQPTALANILAKEADFAAAFEVLPLPIYRAVAKVYLPPAQLYQWMLAKFDGAKHHWDIL
jgi:hypothetical protein